MRIDSYVSTQGVEATAAAGAAGGGTAQAVTPAALPAEDTASLSSGSQSVSALAAQALAAAEVRYAKVDALQRAVSSGAYTLDPSLIAEALINEAV